MQKLASTREALMTTEAVAKWLGVSTRTVCLWAECNEIPAIKVGRQSRFRERDESAVGVRLPNPAGDRGIAEPAAADPTLAEPVVAKSALAEPVVANPTPAEPLGAESAPAEPAVAEPAGAESAPAESTVADPAP